MRSSNLKINCARAVAIGMSLAALAMAPGCVRRRLLVRSNPPGAMVYVDNQPVGQTPCATSFIYYGTRELRLVKPGYETLTVKQPIPAPWFEIPPVDFLSENVAPTEIQDYRTVSYNLVPQVIVPSDQLVDRAQQLRASTQQGAVLPAAAMGPTAPVFATPPLGPPAIAVPAPAGPVLPPGTTLAPESVRPGVLVPPSSGNGALPPGGRALEPLPTPQ